MDLPTFSFRLYSRFHDSVSNMWKATAEETMLNAAKKEMEKLIFEMTSIKLELHGLLLKLTGAGLSARRKNNYSALSGVAAMGSTVVKCCTLGFIINFVGFVLEQVKKGKHRGHIIVP